MDLPEAERLTEIELCGWIGAASPGDPLVYHRGHLAIDIDATSSRLTAKDRIRLLSVSRRAMRVAQCGLVDLFQRRHGPHDYSYGLVVRARPKTARGLLLAVLVHQPEPVA